MALEQGLKTVTKGCFVAVAEAMTVCHTKVTKAYALSWYE